MCQLYVSQEFTSLSLNFLFPVHTASFDVSTEQQHHTTQYSDDGELFQKFDEKKKTLILYTLSFFFALQRLAARNIQPQLPCGPTPMTTMSFIDFFFVRVSNLFFFSLFALCFLWQGSEFRGIFFTMKFYSAHVRN